MDDEERNTRNATTEDIRGPTQRTLLTHEDYFDTGNDAPRNNKKKLSSRISSQVFPADNLIPPPKQIQKVSSIIVPKPKPI